MNNSNPIPARGTTHKLENKYQRSSPSVVKILHPISGLPAWGSIKELRIHRESSLAGQRGLIIGLPQDWQ